MPSLPTRLTVLAASCALTAGAAVITAATAQASTPACGNSALVQTHTQNDDATGHGMFVLLYRNQSHATCTLTGYPGLDAITKTGHVLAHAKRTLHGYAGGASAVRTITLKPGAFASATVEWLNFNPKTSGSCKFSAAVATTPANTTKTVRMAVSVSVCDLQVHPTVSGTSHNWAFANAQRAWLRGSKASSAAEGKYWQYAINYLRKDHGEFGSQTYWLKKLIALPDSGLTHKQQRQYAYYVKNLDSFFGTPHLYL